MKFRIAILVFCGLLALASRASAKDAASSQVVIESRLLEVGGIGGINWSSLKMKGGDESDKVTAINIQPVLGYFITSNLEIELDPLISVLSYKSGATGKTTTTTNFGAVAGAAYHFMPESQTVPFVFANAGFQTNSATGATSDEKKLSLILPDVGVGVKARVGENGVIRMELFVRNTLNAEGMKDMNELQIGARAGVTIFLRPTVAGN